MIDFFAPILAVLMAGILGVFIYIGGAVSVSKDLRQAVDNNKTIREFYYEKYPNSYKRYYTDWKTLEKRINNDRYKKFK